MSIADPTTQEVTLTASSTAVQLAELQDNRVQITTPGGQRYEGVLSWITHRPAGGMRIAWLGGEDWPSIVPYGSTAQVVIRAAGGVR